MDPPVGPVPPPLSQWGGLSEEVNLFVESVEKEFMGKVLTDSGFSEVSNMASEVFSRWLRIAEEELVRRLGRRDTAGHGRGQALQFVETSQASRFEASKRRTW